MTNTRNAYLQVRKLMIAGYDMRQVTGDDIGKADYIAAQKQVRPPDGHISSLLTCVLSLIP